MYSILIVDNHQQILDVIQASLDSPDFHISLARNARVAISLTDNHHFDLAITDLHIANMNISEFIRKLKPTCKIIGLTGADVIDAQQNSTHAQRWEVDAIFMKPFSIDDMLASIWKLLNQ